MPEHRSDDEIKELISKAFEEEIWRFNDYGPDSLVRAWQLGYGQGVADSRPDGGGL